jgi:hypothetical protein
MAGKSAEPYLPCTDRPVRCRREGCREAATDHIVQLCPIHLAKDEHECGRALTFAHRTYPGTPPPAAHHSTLKIVETR